MNLIDEIRAAIKSKKAVMGYNKTIKYIKTGRPKMVIVAKNIESEKMNDIKHNSKISGVKVYIFDGSSKELGVVCGKPFPVSSMVILE